MTKVQVHVGYDPKASKERVLDAIRRVERGESDGEAHVTFESRDTLLKVLNCEVPVRDRAAGK